MSQVQTGQILKVPCPSCGAKPHDYCMDTSNPNGSTRGRVDFHRSRVSIIERRQEPDADGWMPMDIAPRDASEFDAQMLDGSVRRVHWASDLSGSDQPAFQGFFESAFGGKGFSEVHPVKWRPKP